VSHRLISKSTERLCKRYVSNDQPPPQGTKATDACVQVLERDPEGKAKAPEVMKHNSSLSPKPHVNTAGSSQSRQYSTTTLRNVKPEISSASQTGLPPGLEYPDGGPGHKFGLPDMPLPRTEHFKRRYDPVVEQLTKSLMRHGKLSAAQKVCLPYTGLSRCRCKSIAC
jgi:small subunit ribosomal protein S7